MPGRPPTVSSHWVGTPNSKTHFIANNDPNHVALRVEGAHATFDPGEVC